MSKRLLLLGVVVAGLLTFAVAAGWMVYARKIPEVSAQPRKLPQLSVDVDAALLESQQRSGTIDLHLNWIAARPDAVRLLQPAPIWSTSEVQEMFPAILRRWISDWDNNVRTDNDDKPLITKDDVSDLDTRLSAENPPLPTQSIIRLQQLLTFQVGNDEASQSAVRLALGRIALKNILRELATSEDNNIMPATMISNIETLPESLWWKIGDGASLERLFKLKLQYLPPNGEACGWAKAGIVGGRYLQGHYKEALDESDKLLASDFKFNGVQESELQWQRGLIFSALGQWSKAAVHLESATKNLEFKHHSDAYVALVIALSRSGDKPSAELVLEKWRKMEPVKSEVVAELINVIGKN